MAEGSRQRSGNRHVGDSSSMPQLAAIKHGIDTAIKSVSSQAVCTADNKIGTSLAPQSSFAQQRPMETQKAAAAHPSSQKPKSGVPALHDGQVMRSVVRNMVSNMECVLSDLHGIMGEIQSLVVQIDAVTDKIDKQNELKKDVNSSCPGCDSKLKKTCAEHLSPHHDQMYRPRQLPNRVEGNCPVGDPSHNYGDLDCQKRTEKWILRSRSEQFETKRPGLNIPNARSHQALRDFKKPSMLPQPVGRDITKSRLPKAVRHFSRDADSVASPSGGIAIVYPTIQKSSKLKFKADENVSQMTFDPGIKLPDKLRMDDRRHPHHVSKPHVKGLLQFGIDPSSKLFHHNATKKVTISEDTKSAQSKDDIVAEKASHHIPKQKHTVTSVYNMAFQPITPTEQKGSVETIETVYDEPYDSYLSFKGKHLEHQKNMDHNEVLLFTEKRKHFPQNTIGNNSSTAGSLPSSPFIKRNAHVKRQRSISNSPLFDRTARKHIYSKIAGSTMSSDSPWPEIRSISRHYYQSIDSDLDSESQVSRSQTPDMDLSFLSLIGEEARKQNATNFDQGYETPIILDHTSGVFRFLQSTPDVLSRIPPSSRIGHNNMNYLQEENRRLSRSFSDLSPVLHSPGTTHVFCSEVTLGAQDEYCGFYEAMMDSVLENVAGYETFEEACEHVDNDDAVQGTYFCFDEEFDEEQWGVGLKPEDEEEEYDLDMLSLGFDVFEENSDRKEIMGNAESAVLSEAEKASLLDYLKSNDNFSAFVSQRDSALEEGEGHFHCTHDPQFSDNEICNRPDTSETTTSDSRSAPEVNKSTADNSQESSSAQESPDSRPLHPRPKSFNVPSGGPLQSFLCSSDMSSVTVTQETSSDSTTSCQAVASGSPMSFSSPEAAFASPDTTDHLVTSSEGDDLFTSQEEAYLPNDSVDSNGNRRSMQHRTNMRQLRQEFFNSLYSVCEQREREGAQGMEVEDRSQEQASSSEFLDNKTDDVSDTGSYSEGETGGYNRNLNTWTAYPMVHVQADDISDSASDIINDNSITCSMTSSYIDADNIACALAT